MKTKLIEGLKTKFDGVQDSVLNRIAEKLAKTVANEDGVATAIEGVTLQQVIDSYADSRATEATQSAVSNYEKKHNIKDGKLVVADPKPADQKTVIENDDTPAWAKGLIESNKVLSEKLAAIEGEKMVKSRKELLDAAIEKAPDHLKSRYTKDFDRLNFKDDAEYQEWLTDLKTDAETYAAEMTAQGIVFTKPKGGGGTNPDAKPSAEVQARIDKNNAVTVEPAIKGLPTK